MSDKWSKISMTIHDFDLEEPVYTKDEAAELLGCSVQTLNRWHALGDFKAYTIRVNNRIYRYYDAELISKIKNSDLYKCLPQIANSDLIGKRFGKLLVLGFSDKSRAKGYYGSYNCICDCGNNIVLPRSSLLSGKHLSCGCRYTDLTGCTFGEWYVESFADKYISPSGHMRIQYNCVCSCGTRRVVLAGSLLNGLSYSCGCYKPLDTMSKGELYVLLYFENKGFVKNKDYFQYKRFSDLIGIGGRYLSYDFYFEYKNHKYLIECQGGQHYFPVDLWGGESHFNKVKKHDELKRQYANDNGYVLIEIPYNLYSYDKIEKFLNSELNLG